MQQLSNLAILFCNVVFLHYLCIEFKKASIEAVRESGAGGADRRCEEVVRDE